MTALNEINFYLTPEHDCSYLEGKQASTLFADPLADIDTALYSRLSAAGFRRSGAQIYRPHCQTCNACIAARVPVASFRPRRSQKRVMQRNRDLVVTERAPAMSDEYFGIFERYINDRHAGGDMHPASREQFDSFLVAGRSEARFHEFRADGTLLAVAVADRLDDGLSAIYTFFEPAAQQRALGVYAILWLIEEAKRQGLAHLYLGYWIKECPKMSYKLDYRPVELLVNGAWTSA